MGRLVICFFDLFSVLVAQRSNVRRSNLFGRQRRNLAGDNKCKSKDYCAPRCAFVLESKDNGIAAAAASADTMDIGCVGS